MSYRFDIVLLVEGGIRLAYSLRILWRMIWLKQLVPA